MELTLLNFKNGSMKTREDRRERGEEGKTLVTEGVRK